MEATRDQMGFKDREENNTVHFRSGGEKAFRVV